MVCGHTHPQNNLPNAAVKRTMKIMKVTMVSPKMKKSCGQNIFPKMMNFDSGILKRNKGLPFNFIKGIAINKAKNPRLTNVRIL